MKWASTIPSGGGGSSAIWHLHWLGPTPRLPRGLQPTLWSATVWGQRLGRAPYGSRPAVPVRPDRRMAPAQDIHQAGHRIAPGTARGAVGPRAAGSAALVTGGLAAVDVQDLAGDVRRCLQ